VAEQDSGRVASLWRYPVKSMAGEELDTTEVTELGLVGDRAYALVDADDQRVATAKNPRKWPHLFAFAASFDDIPRPGSKPPTVRITLPDSTEVGTGQPDVDVVLSRELGRRVSVQVAERSDPDRADVGERFRARSEEYIPDLDGSDAGDSVTDFDLPEGTFFDSAVVHVVTTATLEELHRLYPEGEMATRRFRPNVVVETPGGVTGFVENDWVGRVLHLGERVQLSVTGPCARCVMVTLPQGDLPKDNGILRTVARHNAAQAGVYASVLRGGQLRRGDQVSVQ